MGVRSPLREVGSVRWPPIQTYIKAGTDLLCLPEWRSGHFLTYTESEGRDNVTLSYMGLRKGNRGKLREGKLISEA